MELLKKSHPPEMMSLLELSLGLEILQGLMIGMDDRLLTHQAVFPLLDTLNQSIQLFVIGGVVDHCLSKSLWMVANRLVVLHQYCSHGISTGICLYLKLLLGLGRCWYFPSMCRRLSAAYLPTGRLSLHLLRHAKEMLCMRSSKWTFSNIEQLLKIFSL